MNTRNRSTTAFGAAVLVLLSLGCSIDAEVQSTSPLATPQGLAEPVVRDASKLIGPGGGFVESSGVLVEIPPGALLVETQIAIRHQADGSVDLLPDGQQFNIPVLLHLASPPGSAPVACTIQWYDPARGRWVLIASSPEPLGRVAPLTHFSFYRITSVAE